ncbi:MAG: nucleotide sugar dehydrogenase [Bacteroidetes bacterium]|nr:nucleotide sugar dehydrogenase [Bacteroidota bacterium]
MDKEKIIAIIGLGYVGLPLALSFARDRAVIGFDTNAGKIATLQNGRDPNGELEDAAFERCDILFTDDPSLLAKAACYIITVPTPVNRFNVPDLGHLLAASETVGKVLKKGDYVIYESTTYPGCTEEDCVPVLEQQSGLRACRDFKIGYSPERINPGDKSHSLSSVIKVVSGCDATALEDIANLYASIVPAGVHRAPSIRVAEASKITENTQRDLNIALMNELSLIFDRMGINTFDVIEAAATKWNFMKFQPGLVGGNCIGVDPYYLTYKAASLGYESRVIAASRQINDDMARHVARKIITHVLRVSKTPKVLIKGVTFKENVSDIHNSKIVDTVKELLAFNIRVEVEDPYAGSDDVCNEYGLQLSAGEGRDYDAVVVTVPHRQYLSLDDSWFAGITAEHALIVDLKGIYRGRIQSRAYWSL